MRAFNVLVFVALLLSIFLASYSSHAQSSITAFYGPRPNTCANNTLWARAVVEQEDIDMLPALEVRRVATFLWNGQPQAIPNQETIWDPPVAGIFDRSLDFCPAG
jgi:hypothetical protein